MKKGYVIGVDFGTDSARAVVIDTATGETAGEHQYAYPRWMSGKYREPGKSMFRQHPLDYLEALEGCVRGAVKSAGSAAGERVLSIAVDTTGSTPCPVDRNGAPLALLDEFRENANAMFHIWKDHTAVEEADEINRVFSNHNGSDYTKYQGVYSSEWYWAKILHTSRLDRQVKAAAFSWVEHCDWITGVLCGNTNPLTMYRSSCAAGHKGLWHSEWKGFPPIDCLSRIDPYLARISKSFGGPPRPSDTRAGLISGQWAQKLGIPETTVVGGCSFDAHAGAVGAGIVKSIMVSSVGTSTVNMLIEDPQTLSGKKLADVCGQAEDSIIPGYVGIETGQAAFGDIYAWLRDFLLWPIKNLLDESSLLKPEQKRLLTEELRNKLIARLEDEAQNQDANETDGLIAIDWFNGRRYPNINERLRGAIMGLSLGTDAPSVYRALAMSTVFGMQKIFDSLIDGGLTIESIIAVGGIAKKSPFIMQMMADVLKRPVSVSASAQAGARGAAIYGAVAAGCYENMLIAQERLCEGFCATYLPDTQKHFEYAKLYEKYEQLGSYLERA